MLTYITLSCIQTKENLFLLAPLQYENFYVDPKIHIEMNRLKTNATSILLIHQLKKLHNSHVITQALNTTSLCHHYKDINHDHNLQMFHTLCFIWSKLHHASIDVHKYINSSKCSYISIHGGHGLMMMDDIHMYHLNFFNVITSDGSEYITTFNINTKKTYFMCV